MSRMIQLPTLFPISMEGRCARSKCELDGWSQEPPSIIDVFGCAACREPQYTRASLATAGVLRVAMTADVRNILQRLVSGM